MPPEVLEAPASAPSAPEAPSLRDTLEKVVAATPPEPANPLEARTEAPTGDTTRAPRERGPDGKFAPRRAEGAVVPSQEEVDQASQPPEQRAEEHEHEPAQAPDKAPSSWKPASKAKWESIDPDVRAEVVRREREVTRALGDSTNARKFAQSFTEAVNPFAQKYQNSGMTPLQVMQNLMQADVFLSSAPAAQRAQFMAKLISDYKIDVGMLDEALAGGEPTSRPEAIVERMIQERIAPFQQFVQSAEQQRQQALQQEYNQQASHIQSMAQDEQNFPHFDTVRNDMADIMEMNARRKVYLSPQEAYKRAVAMNPDAQAAEQARAGQQRSQADHDAATRSLGASLSVSGAPGTLTRKVDPNDLRGTIEAAWKAHAGR